jgi:hypothetical protein
MTQEDRPETAEERAARIAAKPMSSVLYATSAGPPPVVVIDDDGKPHLEAR